MNKRIEEPSLIQITVIQLDNFGPYTETMGHDREHQIQILLARAYTFLQERFSQKNGLVFQATRDNMIAISNGMSVEEHREIIDQFKQQFPITCSMGIAMGETPVEAQRNASEALQDAGSARSSRRNVLATNGTFGLPNGSIRIAHVDIDDYTVQATDKTPFYDNYYLINQSYLTLMEAFQKIGALCFFNGGDNFVTLCPEDFSLEEFKDVLNEYERLYPPWTLKAGIGKGENAKKALVKANIGLTAIREKQTRDRIVLVE